MSPSTRSNSASQSSPETGDAPTDGEAKSEAAIDKATEKVSDKATEKASDKPAAQKPRSGKVEIELELSRQRLIGWTVFGTVVGTLLVLKLGTVGVWVGFVLIGLGLLRGFQLVQTFMHPPGTIRVTDNKVSLPRGLCMSKPVEVAASDVTAVYFLRRSVPWNRSAPVLVIELGEQALAYPRDWFANEADQRIAQNALRALLPDHGVLDPEADDESARA